MAKFLIHFRDGVTVEKVADTGDQAKATATHDRQRETGATERRDPRVKVRRVERLGTAS